ncbi:hypothetical protein, partial [Corynebacterium striatum]|uniref:hypothetical protein n=2 Tax=Corynebacterium striatum TaxID=43770 RepID=UPI00254DA0F3
KPSTISPSPSTQGRKRSGTKPRTLHSASPRVTTADKRAGCTNLAYIIGDKRRLLKTHLLTNGEAAPFQLARSHISLMLDTAMTQNKVIMMVHFSIGFLVVSRHGTAHRTAAGTIKQHTTRQKFMKIWVKVLPSIEFFSNFLDKTRLTRELRK